VSVFEILPTLGAVLLFLGSGLYGRGRPPFEGWVGSPQPESVSGVRFWHEARYGEGARILYFHIDPEDFDKLLEARDYKHSENPHGHRFTSLEDLHERDPDVPIPLPEEPLTHCYSWSSTSEDSMDGKSKAFFTNEAHSVVYFESVYW
jgi:hypothetical protein